MWQKIANVIKENTHSAVPITYLSSVYHSAYQIILSDAEDLPLCKVRSNYYQRGTLVPTINCRSGGRQLPGPDCRTVYIMRKSRAREREHVAEDTQKVELDGGEEYVTTADKTSGRRVGFHAFITLILQLTVPIQPLTRLTDG